MEKLDRQVIKNLMQLSRIDCSEEEQKELLHDLKNVISYVEQLQEVDTQDIMPCNHVLADIFNVMRDDQVGETMPRELFLANAPSHTGGMIRVPPVLKPS